MNDPRAPRLVNAALRCYPAHWRWRHADEATELAALLIRDGARAHSIAWSYLAGAAREWLTPRPGRRLSAVACALLVTACSLAVSVALLASTQPARAVVGPARQPQPAHCPPGPSAGPSAGQPRSAAQQAGHDRPC